MTALTKYVKQPAAGNIVNYTDAELRKIESAFSNVLLTIQELLDVTAAIESGSFVITATGFSGTAPNGTAYYARSGKIVCLFVPGLSGTSNANTFTLTGIPAAIRPTSLEPDALLHLADNGIDISGMGRIKTTGIIELFRNFSSTGWTAAGAKATASFCMVYLLN